MPLPRNTTQLSRHDLIRSLTLKSVLYRKDTLKLIVNARAGHTGGSLSCVDILNVLYNHIMDISPDNFGAIDRDHYVHSKGHSVEALYVVLADKGFYPPQALDSVEKYGSHYIGHPTRNVPGIEHNTGALGHGLSFSVGLALAAKMDGLGSRVFTLLGDGELTEGSNWEASASAAHYQLDNLVVLIDRNTLQITNRTEKVMAMEPLAAKFEAFGFTVREVDGNSISGLADLLETLPFESGKPNLVIAHTVKGKGVHFMEDNTAWHHRVPTSEEFEIAMHELELAKEELEAAHA